MFGFGKRKPREPAPAAPAGEDQPQQGLFSRLKSRLAKTRHNLADGLADLVLGSKRIDDNLLEELETLLLTADVGVETTSRIIDDLTGRVRRNELSDPQALGRILREQLRATLDCCDQPVRQAADARPQVILMVGINGAGKTTTIGKLAKRLQEEGQSVMLAAGDTFRAAAVEQLQSWGERNAIPVIAQHTGADSASVIFDALQAATARGVDVLIADTAGRLHTKGNLMEELAKIARVMKKLDPDAPHEVMLVVDATTGQNALNQAQQFHHSVPLTGITLTKLDGTAKGGIVFAIADRMRIPIRFIGVGEAIDDLRHFDAVEFVDALFEK
ncbi:MAG: signal recognition particle-docking protein FtsY [Candidatus Sedimenticola endophacoides]|uniref:Signal recognition particle receptor FtsY n=2 Tax=Candidatus Sedimenticola endophacoides TaxID=2548426 RepID=A0A6N4E0F9_9GAMM|nr:MAG: signal recognition particle-docking protein FtsY [Candidatus Sedimenticola endophacoides]OQX35669.1 MAG: signal recognition particle-docking protein FtsY [Candidatus Sedimenticola endophacoides]OQX40428.1 MAG: signal recognition particle-docking protein FtsY [Candidatus Sedimenticola endophacoides]OQX44933.1 MAG: signal recognition particle-docking protein FtsY [Candidatus Sedimenticola endophacoides]PUE01354.1 MAG: signal recognition particle-docking protein FtsY [Candidatus Sedimentic